jgi:hypothetical protein
VIKQNLPRPFAKVVFQPQKKGHPLFACHPFVSQTVISHVARHTKHIAEATGGNKIYPGTTGRTSLNHPLYLEGHHYARSRHPERSGVEES